ncbi:MAG TPA: SDR family oxidoreductase [Propionibacteriaceae bacterium]|jgi:NAD(P)-dependent dehydrogenase (short-subunit alcohol dehydrogenase family)|nr:SDR family oxidoreductase [Propionibacteriaceae bacterium]
MIISHQLADRCLWDLKAEPLEAATAELEQTGRLTRTAIVDVSDSGQVGFAMSSAYVAAKHAVVGITKAAAWERAADGIRVNAVGPGFIMTRCMIIAHQSPTRSSASTVSAHSRLAHP